MSNDDPCRPDEESRSQIFRDKSVLDVDRPWDRLVHRDDQITQVTRALTSFWDGARARSILGIGSLGTGKTAVARYVAKNFQEESGRNGFKILTAYVSCIQSSNTYDVLVEAGRQVHGNSVSRGLGRSDYVDALAQESRNAQGFILVLDEVDRLALRKTQDFSDLLYILSRSIPHASAIMLTSKRKVADVLQREINGRSRDTFMWDPLAFPAYDALQLHDIVTPRMELAYETGLYDQGIIGRICAVCVDQGLGARGAIEIARRIGEMAESRGERFLRADDVDVALREIIRRLVREPILSLDRPCKAILKVLLSKKSPSNHDMELYYASHVAPSVIAGESREAFYYHLGHLRELGLVASYRSKRRHGRGSEGHLEVDPLQRAIIEDALGSEGDNRS